ncbi:MAG: TAXI family TRAP transporter solute-binding subunit, partial [Bacillota bacterium]
GAAAIEEVAIIKDVIIVTIEEDKIDWLIDTYPYYSREVIPADTYSDVPEATTVAVLAMIVGHADLSDELAYEFVSQIFENIDTIHGAHERGQLVTLDTALEGMPIDLHPAAERYYREQGLIN